MPLSVFYLKILIEVMPLYAESHYAEYCNYLNLILSVIMLNAIKLSVTMLNVIKLSVIMLSVIAPIKEQVWQN
jgi:hypothetical protein